MRIVKPLNLLVASQLTISVGYTIAANPSTPASQPVASRPADGAKIVATVLGKPIDADELRPPRTASTKPGNISLDRFAIQRLSGLILTPLTAQFVRENHLEITPDELKSTSQRIRQSIARVAEKKRTELAATDGKLKAGGLDEREREVLVATKRVLERVIDLYAKAQSRPHEEGQDLAERFAEWQLSSWKLNRALYRKYGGEVIWQQAGVEAVGAMRAFLEEHEKAGHFQIFDPRLREEFWKYYTRTNHPSPVTKTDPFGCPPWEEEPVPSSRDALVLPSHGIPASATRE